MLGQKESKRARARTLCRGKATGPAALLWARELGKCVDERMRLRPQRKWRGGEIRSALKARERRGINFKKTTRQKKQINKHKKKQKKEKKKHRLQGPFANYQHLHLLIRSNEHFLNSLFSPNMNISFSLTCNMRVDSFQ